MVLLVGTMSKNIQENTVRRTYTSVGENIEVCKYDYVFFNWKKNNKMKMKMKAETETLVY